MALVQLTWSATGVCDSYNIYRKPAGGSYPASPLATVPSSQLNYTDSAAIYGAQYTYGVYAVNMAGESFGGSEVTVTVTLPKPSTPGPVSAVVLP